MSNEIKSTIGEGNVKFNADYIGQVQNLPIEGFSVPISHPRKYLGKTEDLLKSIQKNGLQEPLMVCPAENGKGFMVIDGTRRLTALLELGWKSIPCIVREQMNLAQVTHVAFVKNDERNSFNPIEIALHLRTMQERFRYSLRDLETMGYGTPPNISQKIKLLDLPKKVQELICDNHLTKAHGTEILRLDNPKYQERMAKQAMDYDWSAKRLKNVIHSFIKKGKALPKERVAVPAGEIPHVYFKDARDMSELAEESVHLVVTSPPYCVGMEYEKGISYPEQLKNMEEVSAELSRVLEPGGIIALNVDDIYHYKGEQGNNDFSQIKLVGHDYQDIFRRHKIYLTDIITWVKTIHAQSGDISKAWSDKTPHTGYRIHNNHEPIYIFRKKGERSVPSEEAALDSRITKQEWDQWGSGVWMINRLRKMEGHPSIFPDELVNRIIRMFSYVGDTVLDPFLGSGTTVKVARELNRHGVGYEREMQYKSVIMKKLGITEEAPVAESMAGYVKQSMKGDFLDLVDAREEAKSASSFFKVESETAGVLAAE